MHNEFMQTRLTPTSRQTKYLRKMILPRQFRSLSLLACALLSLLGSGIANSSLAREEEAPQAEEKITINIRITGLESEEGQVRIAVFDSAENWLQEPVYGAVLDVEGQEVNWEIEGVLQGHYAIATFHDENQNGENDLNFLGIPKEDYGFSNDARGKFGPPKWKKAKFDISDSDQTIEIEIR